MDEDFDKVCLQARVDFHNACIAEDFDEVLAALDNVYGLAARYKGRTLPFLESLDVMTCVIGEAQNFQGEEGLREQFERSYQARIAKLPTARELIQRAEAAGEKFEFEQYTFWREEDGWALTNPYGIDNCAYLTTVESFERFLQSLRDDEDIGLVPTGCDFKYSIAVAVADEQRERRYFCHQMADRVLESISA